MLRVEAPGRISTPGHSMSAAGSPVAVRVTPSFGAEEKKLDIRLVNVGESAESTLEEDEQPVTSRPPISSAAARRALPLPSSCPGRIGNTRLLPTETPRPRPYTSQTVATPRPDSDDGGRTTVIRLGIVLETREQQMVLPDPVDAKILAGKALALEAGLFQEPDGPDIGGDASGFDAVQPQCPERERNDGIDRRGHMALPRMDRPHPVAEAAGLGAATADIGQRQAADEHIVRLAEDEERIGEIAALVLG